MEEQGDGEARNQPTGRRPLVIPPNQSKLLNQIRISLSHLNRDKEVDLSKLSHREQEITKSTPNLIDQRDNNLVTKTSQTGYKSKEMQRIRQDLQSFQIAQDMNFANNEFVNGYLGENVKEHEILALLKFGEPDNRSGRIDTSNGWFQYVSYFVFCLSSFVIVVVKFLLASFIRSRCNNAIIIL